MNLAARALFLAAIAAPCAAAQDHGANDPKIQAAAESLAAVYSYDLMENVTGDCLIRLDAKGSYDMFDVWLSPGCETAFPYLSYLRSWAPVGDSIRLYGTEGVTLGEFKRVIDVGYVATLEADGKSYVLSQMLQ